MFLAMARPRPVPPRLVVKYGIEHPGQVQRRSMPAPRSAMTIVTRLVLRLRAQRDERFRRRTTAPDRRRPDRRPCRPDCRLPIVIGLSDRATAAVWSLTACRALTSMLTSAMRSRSESVVTVAAAGIELQVHRRAGARGTATPPPIRGRARSDRPARARSGSASRSRGLRSRCGSAASTSSSMSATASRDRRPADARLAQRVQRSLDDHQRVAHFVRDDGGQPAERRQPLLLRHLALEARDRIRSAC